LWPGKWKQGCAATAKVSADDILGITAETAVSNCHRPLPAARRKRSRSLSFIICEMKLRAGKTDSAKSGHPLTCSAAY
jgi:hypothetical protein